MKLINFTQQGYEKLKFDYEKILKARPFAVLDLKKAREMGDLSENGYYKSAKAKLSSLDYKMRTIKLQLKQAVISNKTPGVIGLGSKVKLKIAKTEITYNIVGDLEADPSLNKISTLSPIGKALIGKKINEETEINTPAGKTKLKILDIS